MNRIREIRELKEMTQEELASRIGVSRENVSRYETGKRIPPSDKFIQIADVLDCSLDELAGREKVPEAG